MHSCPDTDIDAIYISQNPQITHSWAGNLTFVPCNQTSFSSLTNSLFCFVNFNFVRFKFNVLYYKFIPHNGVYHHQKPDKIRVVFDCSAQFQGISLNNKLFQGTDITNNLVRVLIPAPLIWVKKKKKLEKKERPAGQAKQNWTGLTLSLHRKK